MAEKEGFEPSIPFWGIHDFQSCALGQLRDFSMRHGFIASPVIILYLSRFVKHYFSFFHIFLSPGSLDTGPRSRLQYRKTFGRSSI